MNVLENSLISGFISLEIAKELSIYFQVGFEVLAGILGALIIGIIFLFILIALVLRPLTRRASRQEQLASRADIETGPIERIVSIEPQSKQPLENKGSQLEPIAWRQTRSVQKKPSIENQQHSSIDTSEAADEPTLTSVPRSVSRTKDSSDPVTSLLNNDVEPSESPKEKPTLLEEELGHYQIKELLGEGAFALVYRAFDRKFEHDVALKILKPIWLGDREAIARFKQEAKTVHKLRHAHIINVYDVGEIDGQIYLSQFLVQGESLAKRLKRSFLTWKETLKIARDIGSALDYAHREGIIHRDIKPGNILLAANNEAYLGDFGLVLAVEGSTHLSSTVSMIGTAHYMAPEVWDGKKATPATDVYALSCVVFEMLTGQVLFEGSSMMAVLKKHLSGPKLPSMWPVGIPKGVTAVLQRGLAENPAVRFSSAGELVTALEALHS